MKFSSNDGSKEDEQDGAGLGGTSSIYSLERYHPPVFTCVYSLLYVVATNAVNVSYSTVVSQTLAESI